MAPTRVFLNEMFSFSFLQNGVGVDSRDNDAACKTLGWCVCEGGYCWGGCLLGPVWAQCVNVGLVDLYLVTHCPNKKLNISLAMFNYGKS